MNQKHAECTVLNRHTSVQALGKTFGEVLNPSSLKNNLTNSLNSKCPGFSQSLLFKGVRFRKMDEVSSLLSPHPHNTMSKTDIQEEPQTLPLECYWRGNGALLQSSPHKYIPTHHPPREKWLQEAGLVQGSVSFDVITSVSPTLGNTHNSHWM